MRIKTLAIVAALFLLSASAAVAKTPITGTATNQKGKPIIGALVTVTDTEGNVFDSGETDKKGRFKVTVESPGNYVLRIKADGYGPDEKVLFLESGVPIQARVTLIDAAVYKQQQSVVLFNDAVAALQRGDLNTAEVDFKKALELNPDLIQAHGALATIYHGLAKWEEAVASIESLPRGPMPPQLAPVAFDAYRRTGDMKKANEALAAVQDASIRRSLAEGVYDDGVAYSDIANMGEARRHFELALEVDPTIVVPHRSLAALEFNEQEFEAAVPHLEQLLAKEPGDGPGARMLYVSLDRLGREDLQGAMSAYLDSGGEEVAEEILASAANAFAQNSTKHALRRLQPLVELRPEMAQAQFTLGLPLASSDPAAAKEHLQKFLDLAPSDPDAETAKAMITEL